MDEQVVQRGKQWLERVLDLMACPAAVRWIQPEELETRLGMVWGPGDPPLEDPACWLEIELLTLSSELVVAWEKGILDVLDSLQYLANTTLNLGCDSGGQQAYTFEFQGHRLQRLRTLKAMAERAAAEVRETGKAVEMTALSSAERRQVHTFLKTFGDLATESQGIEPDRRLVVLPR